MTYFFKINGIYYMKTPHGVISVTRVAGHQAGPVNVPALHGLNTHLNHPMEFWKEQPSFEVIDQDAFYAIFSLAVNSFTGMASKYLTRKV